MSNIKKIVLTGGPCAGKTTALVKIIEHFSSRGYKVFTVPEVPTIFLQAGMDYLTKNKALFYEGEKATLEIQMAMERSFMKICFVMNPEYAELEKPFFEYATSLGMVGIKGHRSVGGFRASCYNAQTIEGVNALVNAMKEFEKNN